MAQPEYQAINRREARHNYFMSEGYCCFKLQFGSDSKEYEKLLEEKRKALGVSKERGTKAPIGQSFRKNATALKQEQQRLGCDAFVLLDPKEVSGSEKIMITNESMLADRSDSKEYEKLLEEKRKALGVSKERGTKAPIGQSFRKNATALKQEQQRLCVKLAKFFVYLVSSHGWLGMCTQHTPREVDRWEIEKVKAPGANGVKSGSRVRVVWMEVSGGVVRARVVSIVVVKIVLIGWEVFKRWFWMGEDSLEDMSMKSVRGILFGEFWVEELALEAMEVRVVWMEVSGGVVRARVVSIVVVKIVLIGWEVFKRWFWMGGDSLEDMSMKSVRGILFGGFWVEELALEAMEEWDQECSCPPDHSPPLDEELEKVNRMTQCRGSVRMIGTNVFKESGEKHSIGKCHIGTFGHTHHSVGNVVGEVEGFFNGEVVEHVA
nr:hypothetical protein [Tanacetum cinerariifolium]